MPKRPLTIVPVESLKVGDCFKMGGQAYRVTKIFTIRSAGIALQFIPLNFKHDEEIDRDFYNLILPTRTTIKVHVREEDSII